MTPSGHTPKHYLPDLQKVHREKQFQVRTFSEDYLAV